MKTVRDVTEEHPSMWSYEYSRKWADERNYRSLTGVLADFGYALITEDKEYVGEYNDLKGYLNCKVVSLEMSKEFCCEKCGTESTLEEWMAETKKDYSDIPLLTPEMIDNEECYCYICPNCGETCYVEDGQISEV